MKNTIGNTVVLALFVLLIGNFIYGVMPASTESIQEAAYIAEKTEDGKILSIDFFKKYSTPTNNEVYALKKLSNEIIVRDIARHKTGDNTIKTITELEKEKLLSDDQKIKDFFNSRPIQSIDISFLQLFAVVMFLSIIYLVFLGFSYKNRGGINTMSELPKRIQEYYASLKDEDILDKIKHLTNMEKVMGKSQNLTDQLREFKNEADRRGLDYKIASCVNK